MTQEGMYELEQKMDQPDSPSMCISTPYNVDGDVW